MAAPNTRSPQPHTLTRSHLSHTPSIPSRRRAAACHRPRCGRGRRCRESCQLNAHQKGRGLHILFVTRLSPQESAFDDPCHNSCIPRVRPHCWSSAYAHHLHRMENRQSVRYRRHRECGRRWRAAISSQANIMFVTTPPLWQETALDDPCHNSCIPHARPHCWSSACAHHLHRMEDRQSVLYRRHRECGRRWRAAISSQANITFVTTPPLWQETTLDDSCTHAGAVHCCSSFLYATLDTIDEHARHTELT